MKKTFQDIRILSLYKQHYFDHYNPDMDNQFSCLGYYDGISVTEIPAEDPEEPEAPAVAPATAEVQCAAAEGGETAARPAAGREGGTPEPGKEG